MRDHIKIALFYMELIEDRRETTGDNYDRFLKICTVLRFYIGQFLFDEIYLEFSSRLLWLYVASIMLIEIVMKLH